MDDNTGVKETKVKKRKKALGIILIITAAIILSCVIAGTFCAAVYVYISVSTSDRMYQLDSDIPDGDYDCILILGCGVRPSGEPSDMLRDRLLTGLELYERGCAATIIVSGDHGRTEYDEVNTMKDFLMDRGVPDDDVFMDHAGFSTYDSIYRADYIFGVKKMIVVTQDFHLPRALFIADRHGTEAVGVIADRHSYAGVWTNYLREVPARIKDFFTTALSVRPKYLGDPIPLDEGGSATNDRTDRTE